MTLRSESSGVADTLFAGEECCHQDGNEETIRLVSMADDPSQTGSRVLLLPCQPPWEGFPVNPWLGA